MSILDKASADNSQGWRLLKQNDNRFWFCFGFCQWNSPGTAISQTYVTAGQWYHVALTKDDSEFILYVDGVAERVRGTPTPLQDDHGADLKIGRNSHDGAHMNGAVDEVQIYHRALAAEEVASIAAAGAAGVCKAVPEPDDEVLVSAYVNARVNCRNRRGLLPVTILGSDAFDVSDLEVSTIRFGPTGTEAAEAHGRGHYRDVDSDGDLDLVLHFARGEANLDCDNAEALLTGETEDGASFSTTVLLNVAGGLRR